MKKDIYHSLKKLKLVNILIKKKGETKPIMYEIRFLDTFAFMASSLESLATNLRSSDDINELRKIFKNTSNEFKNDEQFLLMIQKGIYPYDYIENFNKLYENYLPDINSFYSKLNKSNCDIKDYKHAQNVFKTFGCKNILDYYNIYLKSDVLLLSDIWDNFRKVCYTNYGLDTCYYYTAPGLSFDAMLKITKINLELLTDVDMFKMVESGIRGGISQISHRHAIANNKYMSNYKPSNIINDENMYKFLYYDNTLKTKIDKIEYAIINVIKWYNNSKKRTHVNEIKLIKVEYKYDRLFKIYDYKIFFVTDGNENVKFNSMGTIFYNKIELRTHDVEIIDAERDDKFVDSQEMIFEQKQEIKRELKQYIDSKRTNDKSKNIVYKDKETGNIIPKNTLNEIKIKEGIEKGLLEIIDDGESCTVYLNANNLYDYAKCQYLPMEIINGMKKNGIKKKY